VNCMTFLNPYTQVVVDSWEEKDLYECLTAEDRIKMPPTCVKGRNNLNKTWGPWQILCKTVNNCTYYTLYHEACRYEIVLNEVHSTGDVLDWVLHMSSKSENTYGTAFVYFLGCAFTEICAHSSIHIRSNTEFDGTKVARKYWQDLQGSRCVSVKLRHQILERDRFTCMDCGATPADGAKLEVDHTIPVSKGGSNDPSNLRTLCSDCNRGKSNRLVNYPDAVTEV